MTFVPLDGRLTSLQVLPTALNGGEVMYLVSPGTAALGNSYQVTTAVLGAYFSSFQFTSPTVITSGATLATPYNIKVSDTRILLNKTVNSASYLVAPLAASMLAPFPLLVKDFKGSAYTYPISINFTGGEFCDGQSTITIGGDYGWTTINPNVGGGGWYQT